MSKSSQGMHTSPSLDLTVNNMISIQAYWYPLVIDQPNLDVPEELTLYLIPVMDS